MYPVLFPLLAAALSIPSAVAFSAVPSTFKLRSIARNVQTSATTMMAATGGVEPGSKVLVVGAGLTQLIVAKHLKEAGLFPLIVVPFDKRESFSKLIGDDEIMDYAQIGLPEKSDPVGTGWREGIDSVVFCGEDPLAVNSGVIGRCLIWDGFGSDKDASPDGPKRAIACVPITNKINKEKEPGWAPLTALFNSEKRQQEGWDRIQREMANSKVVDRRSDAFANIIRFGSLFGGGTDGPPELATKGLDEGVYKMSLEQYRDLRERAFDRNKLGAQVMLGDATNPIPVGQEELEKKTLNEAEREAFGIGGGYPEQDRTGRHVLAAAIVQSLLRPVGDGGVPKDFTVLSKAERALPTEEEWDAMFASPGPASWPDPGKFEMPQQPEVPQEA